MEPELSVLLPRFNAATAQGADDFLSTLLSRADDLERRRQDLDVDRNRLQELSVGEDFHRLVGLDVHPFGLGIEDLWMIEMVSTEDPGKHSQQGDAGHGLR